MERPILTPEQRVILEELEKELKGWNFIKIDLKNSRKTNRVQNGVFLG